MEKKSSTPNKKNEVKEKRTSNYNLRRSTNNLDVNQEIRTQSGSMKKHRKNQNKTLTPIAKQDKQPIVLGRSKLSKDKLNKTDSHLTQKSKAIRSKRDNTEELSKTSYGEKFNENVEQPDLYLMEIEAYTNNIALKCDKIMKEKHNNYLRLKQSHEEWKEGIKKQIETISLPSPEIDSTIKDQTNKIQHIHDRFVVLEKFHEYQKERNRRLAEKARVALKFQHSEDVNKTIIDTLDDTILCDTPKALVRKILMK